MKIIVGLGNLGEKYQKTRHNAGFIFIDELIKSEKITSFSKPLQFQFNKKFKAEMAEVEREGEKIIFAKPQTFMNLSGESVRKMIDYWQAEIKDLIIVTDEVDLPLGTVRIRLGGSSGGHQGLASVIRALGQAGFVRIRIGISRPVLEQSKIETEKYVLEKFSRRESQVFQESVELTIDYLIEFLGKKMTMPSHTLEVGK